MTEIMHEKSIRILSALGLNNKEIADEMDFLDLKDVEKIKRRLGNVYTQSQIIEILDENTDRDISQLAQIPEEIVMQIREKHRKQEEGIRILTALGASESEITKSMNLRFNYYTL